MFNDDEVPFFVGAKNCVGFITNERKYILPNFTGLKNLLSPSPAGGEEELRILSMSDIERTIEDNF